MENPRKQMRDWQKVLAKEGGGEAVATTVAEAKVQSVPPQVMSAGFVFVLVFALLAVLRPPFVESADKDRPLQPRRLHWGIVFATSAASAVVVLLSSV